MPEPSTPDVVERDRYLGALEELSAVLLPNVRLGDHTAVRAWNIARRALEEGVLDRA